MVILGIILLIGTLFAVLIAIGAGAFALVEQFPVLAQIFLSAAPFVCGVFAVLIGAAAGAIELMGRYRDAPFEAIKVRGAGVYIGINALVSFVVYILILVFDNDLLADGINYETFIPIAALAGFGSLAIMRTSIAKTEINGKPIEVGPALVIDTLLKVADRAVDRHRATERLDKVPGFLSKLKDDVPLYELESICMKAMQNLDDQEIADVKKGIEDLPKLVPTQTSPGLPKLLAGLLLQQIIGNDVLEKACNVLEGFSSPPDDPADIMEHWGGGPRGRDQNSQDSSAASSNRKKTRKGGKKK